MSMEHGFGYRRYGATRCEYSGDWQNGLRHGKGQFFDQRTGTSYSGNYVENKKHGQGEERVPGISNKDGIWENDMLNGYGRMTEFNPETGEIEVDYKGTFVNDRFEGLGEYVQGDGVKYKGQFKDHCKHGKGILMLPVPGLSKENEPLVDVYDCTFEYDMLHGKGTVRYANGKTYEGNFNQGAKEGFGKESVYENG